MGQVVYEAVLDAFPVYSPANAGGVENILFDIDLRIAQSIGILRSIREFTETNSYDGERLHGLVNAGIALLGTTSPCLQALIDFEGERRQSASASAKGSAGGRVECDVPPSAPHSAEAACGCPAGAGRN